MKNDEPLIRPTMPPASANEKAMIEVGHRRLQMRRSAQITAHDADGHDQRERQQHRDEAEDRADDAA